MPKTKKKREKQRKRSAEKLAAREATPPCPYPRPLSLSFFSRGTRVLELQGGGEKIPFDPAIPLEQQHLAEQALAQALRGDKPLDEV